MKECRLGLRAWAPDEYKEQLEIRSLLPRKLRVDFATIGDNPFSYLAQLFDAQTEGHTDSSDMIGGLAAIKCFGKFKGGDLVFKHLGVAIEYPSGSNALFRGTELHHFITRYWKRRHCIVLTTKESVKKSAQQIKKDMEMVRKEAGKLRYKSPGSLSKKERAMLEAVKDHDDLVQFVYDRAVADLDAKKKAKQASK